MPDRDYTRRRGGRHYRAKLTEDLVIEARRLAREGMSIREITELLGVDISRAGMARAIEGYTWSHVPKPRIPWTSATPGPYGESLTRDQIDRAIELRATGRTWREVRSLVGADCKTNENFMKMVNNRIRGKKR